MGDQNQELEFRYKTTADLKAAEDFLRLQRDQVKATDALNKHLKEQAAAQQRVDKAQEESAKKAFRNEVFFEKQRREAQRAGGITAADLLQSRNLALPSRFDAVKAAYSGAGGGFAGIGAGLAAIGPSAAAGVAAVGAAAVFSTKSLNEYAEAEERVANLNAALAQRGLLKGDYSETLQDRAGALQQATGKKSSEWLGVITRLTQQGAGPQNIDKAVEAVKNLAGLMGGDLEGAAVQVGKALQGEFESFSRLGIVIDEHATKAKNLETVYRELALRGGGQLEASADTIRGAFLRLSNGWSDTKEAAGSVISAMIPLKAIASTLGMAMSYLANKMEGTIGASSRLKNASKETKEALVSEAEAARKAAIDYENLKKKVDDVKDALTNYIAKQRESADLKKTESDAKYDRDIAKINAQEKAKFINPVEAEAARQRLTENHAREKANLDNAARDAAMKKLNDTFVAATNQQSALEQEAAAAKAKVEAAKKTDAQRVATEAPYLAEIDEAKKQMAKSYAGGAFTGAGSDFAGGGARQPRAEYILAKEKLAAVEKKRTEAMQQWNSSHPSEDIAALESDAERKKKAAENWKKENEPFVFGLARQADSMVGERDSTTRVQGFEAETRKIARQEALAGARDREIGEVTHLEGGGLSGTPAAVQREQQVEQAHLQFDNATTGRGGDQNLSRIIQQRDQQIAHYQKIIDAVTLNADATGRQALMISKLEDSVRLLQSQTRNQ